MGAMDEKALSTVLKAAQQKRRSDTVVVEYQPKGLKAHLKGADRVNARYCAVIGEDELKNGTIWVKDLTEKSEATLDVTSL